MRFKKVKSLKDMRDYVKITNIIWSDPPECVLSILMKENAYFWIVMNRDKIVGHFTIYMEKKRTYITEIGLLPSTRGKGIGAKIMNFIIQNYKGPFALHVRAETKNAIYLYQKFGFYVAKRVNRYYNNKGKYLYMRRD